jgi:hypothetical protein
MKNKLIPLALILVLSIAFPVAPLLKMQSDFPERAGSWLCDFDAVSGTYEYALVFIADHAVYYDYTNKNDIFREELTEYLAKHEKSPPLA